MVVSLANVLENNVFKQVKYEIGTNKKKDLFIIKTLPKFEIQLIEFLKINKIKSWKVTNLNLTH